MSQPMQELHTPGPWFVGSRESKAIVTGSPEGAILYRGAHRGFTEADARLIAAAPELLEALETLCSSINFRQAVIVSHSHEKLLFAEEAVWRAHDAARAAIAKATGSAS